MSIETMLDMYEKFIEMGDIEMALRVLHCIIPQQGD